jgi:hypothetical protein
VTDEDRITMTPQPYPLWCATLDKDLQEHVGRVVGWSTDAADMGDDLAVPIVAFAEQDGDIFWVGKPEVSGSFFLADTRDQALQMARTHRARRRGSA